MAPLRSRILLCIAVLLLAAGISAAQAPAPWPAGIQAILDKTQPLPHARGTRLPLYLWPAMAPAGLDDARAEEMVRLMDERGVAVVVNWNAGALEQTLKDCLPIARAQKKLGLLINVSATSLMSSFFDGSPETAHLDADGKPFFDESFGTKTMGCPFRLEQRVAPLRERMNSFLDAYAQAGLPVGFIFSDWEVDGPLEWNHALDASKRCTVCREHAPDLETNFLAYQFALRTLRADLQRRVFAEPVREHFPKALVCNYAEAPTNGWRHWYDYFEHYVPGQPALEEQEARYRHWPNLFASTGYTFAMPVVYPWSWTWNWYNFQPGDYRWFCSGLKEFSSVAENTPANIPLIPFVHYTTVDVGRSERDGAPKDQGEAAQQMSVKTYQELLWHMLLRGADTFYLWCSPQDDANEVEALWPVYAESLQYSQYFEHGTPCSFEIKAQPGVVVSAIRLDKRLLVRRSDFGDTTFLATLEVAGQAVEIPAHSGCLELDLK